MAMLNNQMVYTIYIYIHTIYGMYMNVWYIAMEGPLWNTYTYYIWNIYNYKGVQQYLWLYGGYSMGMWLINLKWPAKMGYNYFKKGILNLMLVSWGYGWFLKPQVTMGFRFKSLGCFGGTPMTYETSIHFKQRERCETTRCANPCETCRGYMDLRNQGSREVTLGCTTLKCFGNILPSGKPIAWSDSA